MTLFAIASQKSYQPSIFFGWLILGCALFAGVMLPTGSVRASATNGTIDSVSKYAWGEDLGWLNFGTSGGAVQVTDAALTGYAWSEHYGWINLAPTGSGVTNNAEGDLEGSAWGENVGYIDFSNVSISSSGVFAGTASSTIAGRISFDCTNCAVATDWRPASVRSAGSGSGGGGGSGGSAPTSLRVLINGNVAFTPTSSVTLSLSFDATIAHMAISNYSDMRDAVRVPIQGAKPWNLCSTYGVLVGTCQEGVRTVYVYFYDLGGQPFGPFTDSIYMSVVPPGPAMPEIPPPTGPLESNVPIVRPPTEESFLGAIGQIFGNLIPNFLKPKPAPTRNIPIEVYITPETPLAFQNIWQMMPEDPIRTFVFAPLPSEFAVLLKKFPQLEDIANEIGISRQADLQKLSGVRLALPGFTGTSLEKSFQELASRPAEINDLKQVLLKLPGFSSSTLSATGITGGSFGIPPGIPLAKLPASVKMNVPSEIVFARTGNELIDLDVSLRINSQGQAQQSIKTLTGTILKLVVRPEYPAERVTGYLTFTSRNRRQAELERQGMPLQSMLGAISFQTPGVDMPELDARHTFINSLASIVSLLFGQTNPTVTQEERLGIREFEYTDPDGDGLYTATIQVPVVEGQYEIYTLIRYQDPERGAKEIRLTTVIDPEGYIYEKVGGKETRIPGAVASIYRLDPVTKEYALWPATEYAQENPQVTDVRGTYAFLVPPGFYYITAEAPGYLPYNGKPFEVRADESGVHLNIELKTEFGWFKAIDWRTVLLVIVTMLLFYNFYKDRRRKLEK